MLGLLRPHIPKCPALGSAGLWAAPSSCIGASESSPWPQLSPVQAPIPRSINEQPRLKPGRVPAMGLWPGGALPSAVLCPLPLSALLGDGRPRQEEVGADGFPQAQADGGVLGGGRSVQQEGAVGGRSLGNPQTLGADRGRGSRPVPTCRSCPS